MPDGTPSTHSHHDLGANAWLQKPIHDQRLMKVISVGAGASGLLLAYKLQRSFEHFDLTLYEKNEDLGGTWLENKYPGCACDIAAHVYTWTFEPNPDWSSVYAGSDEIYQYFDHFSKKYDLRKYCRFKKLITRAEWNNDKGHWEVDIKDLETGNTIHDYCHFLINASGVLNHWKWPDIPGIDTFEGKMLHTARYDRSLDLTDKHVALIGTGSSAIQTLPAIHDKVRKVTVFNRGPAWVVPVQGMEQRHYTDEEKKMFREQPEKLAEHRKLMESTLNSLFSIFYRDSDAQKEMADGMAKAMLGILKESGLEDKVIPRWGVGCRRLTPGVGYLEALVSPKVEVVFNGVKRISPKGCVSEENKEYPVDVIIAATGFDTSYLPRFPIIGSNKRPLSEAWAQEPYNYFGIAVPDYPNYFMFVGPNSPIGNGPVLVGIEAQADYMLKMMNRWQTENIRSISPKMEAVQDLMEYKDQFMKNTVWEMECRSWYKSGSAGGKVTALWPGSTMHYLEAMAEPRYEDWDFAYIGNRFAYFGNGYSQTELDRTADWAYYMRNEDDGPLFGRAKQRRVLTKSGTVVRPEKTEARPVI